MIVNLVVQDQKKILIWMSYSVTQLLILKVLQLMNISAHIFAVYQIIKEQINLITAFIISWDQIMILIESYAMSSVDLNLQALCWCVILFDSPPSISISVQIIDCVHCIENFCITIYVSEISLKKTFNNHITQLSIKKAISSLITELNLSLFRKQDKETLKDMYEKNFSIEEWILIDDKLVSVTDHSVQKQHLFILKSKKFLCHLLKDSQGKVVQK